MNVLRHHHVSDQREIVALANFTENLEKEMTRAFRSQQRHTTITTANNEMQLAQSIAASEAWLHPRNPNPSNPEGFGTPHGSRELSSELVVWYYPPGRHVNAKNNKKGFATRQPVTSDEMVKIRLLGPHKGDSETLWAKRIAPGRYRLDNGPFFAYGVSWQDVVEARPGDDDIFEYVRVVSKSGNRTLRVIFNDYGLDDQRAKNILRGIRELGCSYEGMQPRLVSINVPPEANLDSVTTSLTGLPGLQWEYGDPTYEEVTRAAKD